MKIDIYSHIMPKKYTELYARKNNAIKRRVEYRSIAVVDLDVRLRLMKPSPGPSMPSNWLKSPTKNWPNWWIDTRTNLSPAWPACR
jgi:hypothetical protein